MTEQERNEIKLREKEKLDDIAEFEKNVLAKIPLKRNVNINNCHTYVPVLNLQNSEDTHKAVIKGKYVDALTTNKTFSLYNNYIAFYFNKGK